jgi:hypothetical protein
MGFAIYYRSTEPVPRARAKAIRKAAATLIEGRTWLSCEPVFFRDDLPDGRLWGGSKPNFVPNPEDAESASREGLPDGTVRDLIDVLCTLSRDHGVDWEFHHDYDPGPIGFIRNGVCEPHLLEQMDAMADLGDILSELEGTDGFSPRPRPMSMADSDAGGEDDGDSDDQPPILPFRPRSS